MNNPLVKVPGVAWWGLIIAIGGAISQWLATSFPDSNSVWVILATTGVGAIVKIGEEYVRKSKDAPDADFPEDGPTPAGAPAPEPEANSRKVTRFLLG